MKYRIFHHIRVPYHAKFQHFSLAVVFFIFTAISSVIGITLVRHAGVIATSEPTVQIVSPIDNSFDTGTITLNARLTDTPAQQYDMFWYVDNGQWNWMHDTGEGKAADISLDRWTWHSNNSYTIEVAAVIHGTSQRNFGSITIHTTSVTGNAPIASAVPAVGSTKLFVNPSSNAALAAAQSSDPTMQRVMARLAQTPTATWFGDWNTNVEADARQVMTAAASVQATPVLVAYNIPNRDCTGYSAGGSPSAMAYRQWIQSFAAGVGKQSAIIILEPDALAQLNCLNTAQQSERYELIKAGVSALKANPLARVYIDAGNANWVAAGDMAARLAAAGLARADGFSLNVSNFIDTSDSIAYGSQLSRLVGNQHFVIDTSRNGNGANGQWCNPGGRALGTPPTSSTGNPLVDYYLWIKTPGESDGSCNGGPAAGNWWPAYAESLALAAGW